MVLQLRTADVGIPEAGEPRTAFQGPVVEGGPTAGLTTTLLCHAGLFVQSLLSLYISWQLATTAFALVQMSIT